MTATAGAVGTVYMQVKQLVTLQLENLYIRDHNRLLQDRKLRQLQRRGGNELVRDGLNDSSNQSPEEACTFSAWRRSRRKNILENEGEVNKDGELVLGFNDGNYTRLH